MLFVTPWTAAHQVPLSSIISRCCCCCIASVVSDSVWPQRQQPTRLPHPWGICSNASPLRWWCHTTISPSVATFYSCPQCFPASVLFQWASSPYQVALWSFSFSVSSSNEDSGLTSFRIDWFDLLAVQGTLKSLTQHHSLKTSFLQPSAFFMVQLSLKVLWNVPKLSQ